MARPERIRTSDPQIRRQGNTVDFIGFFCKPLPAPSLTLLSAPVRCKLKRSKNARLESANSAFRAPATTYILMATLGGKLPLAALGFPHDFRQCT